jgi:acyl-CoA dehydrogenase
VAGGVTGTEPPRWCVSDVGRRAWEVGATVAGPAATDVDREARFPFEAVAAMRETGLLGAMVPVDHGGEGASLAEVAEAVTALAGHCASSALVLAMHQIEVAYLIGHGETPALSSLLRDVATGSVLMANANSEVGLGGDVSQSRCALVHDGGQVHLEKEVLALSYGEYADVITVIARREPEAAATDQVMLVCGPGTFSLKATSTWDTMGLRGTCSGGYLLVADEAADMILADSWDMVANRTGLAATTILLNSVWLGIAESAASLAHASVRREARKSIGTTPPSALRLAELVVVLGQARSVMATTITAVEAAGGDAVQPHSAFFLEMRDLKLSTTTLAADVVLKALAVCGLGGYRRDSDNSVERHVRDVLGGQLMANNNRFYVDNARLLTILKQL